MWGIGMWKRLIMLGSLLAAFGWGSVCVAEPDRTIRAAFVRGGDLWLSVDGAEVRVAEREQASSPRWSHDGKLVAYAAGAQADEIKVYSLEAKRSFTVYKGGERYQWAPDRNRLAFTIGSILNVVDVGRDQVGSFRNVTGGVGNYSWLPDGSGFLVSSDAQLLPTGWTPVAMFVVPTDANMDPQASKSFYTLPGQSDRFFAVGTTSFRWSADRRWIAFIARPTASMSADSNTLCVLSSDAGVFRRLDRMLHYESWFQWAPGTDALAYIEGEGRFALDNKHLRIRERMAWSRPSYTPKGYVDRDFTWLDDRSIVVARSAAHPSWSSDPANRPLPSLYRLDLVSREQRQLTQPPAGSGDLRPVYLQRSGKLTWIRYDRNRADAWIASPDGSREEPLIRNIGTGTGYYDWWDWDAVLAWYEPLLGGPTR